MYKEMIERERAHKKWALWCIPLAVLVIIGFWWVDLDGRVDFSPLWIKIGCTLLLLLVISGIIKAYKNFDKNIENMRRGIHAQSDEDMERIMQQSQSFEGKYFISERGVINFDDMLAYPHNDIVKLECKERQSDPHFELLVDHGVLDVWFFHDPRRRDEAYHLLMQYR